MEIHTYAQLLLRLRLNSRFLSFIFCKGNTKPKLTSKPIQNGNDQDVWLSHVSAQYIALSEFVSVVYNEKFRVSVKHGPDGG